MKIGRLSAVAISLVFDIIKHTSKGLVAIDNAVLIVVILTKLL